MPAITPNLLIIDADVAAAERASAIVTDFPAHLLIAHDCNAAINILSEHLIDLIVLDRNVIAGGQQLDTVVAKFHGLKGRHDVPVLITCVTARCGVFLKTHPWGVAYHVHKAVEPTVLKGLIHASLTLKVGYGSNQHQNAKTPNAMPKPLGLPLPEVIMPSNMQKTPGQNVPRG